MATAVQTSCQLLNSRRRVTAISRNGWCLSPNNLFPLVIDHIFGLHFFVFWWWSFSSEWRHTVSLAYPLHLTYKLEGRLNSRVMELSFLKKWAIPGLFLVIFGLFQSNNTIFITNQCEKMSCPSNIRCRYSNPRPLECDSPPITTRPGLPPQS